MNTRNRTILMGAAVAALMVINGCSTYAPPKPSGIEQRIESAQTSQDHHNLAAEYEKQAAMDQATVKRHQKMAVTYRHTGPRGHTSAMAAHCENLARVYQKAAEENLALARLHHEAAEALGGSTK